jgi:1,4-dihydroxy-2-naphthoate octaprenyltransferase
MMDALVAFVRLSRLKFLAGGFIGCALGTAIAAYERGRVDLPAYALAQFALTAAHLMSHYANEYYDQASDARATRTRYSGGSGVLVDGLLSPNVALRAALVCVLVSCSGVVAILAMGHALAGLCAALATLLAWAYSAPPLRLLARGLGEANTVLVVAVLVPLCAYAAQTGALDARAIATTLPSAVAMFAMMLCVEIPDVAADGATGKRNLVVRFGSRSAASVALATLVLVLPAVALAYALGAPASYALLGLGAAVPILRLAAALQRLRRSLPIESEAIAERGVALFAIVGSLGTVGYAAALRWHS